MTSALTRGRRKRDVKVRNRVGQERRGPPPAEKLLLVLGLRAAGTAGPATENPRVSGSIPHLVTTSISMNHMRYLASPVTIDGPRRAESTDQRTTEYLVVARE